MLTLKNYYYFIFFNQRATMLCDKGKQKKSLGFLLQLKLDRHQPEAEKN